jgi:ArsR family transcriptional regulator
MALPPLRELRLLHTNICKALGDPKRIQILYALNEKPRNVSSLASVLKTPQPTVSRHLAILRQRSLVSPERDGQMIVYHLADARIIDVLDAMRRILRDSLERQSSVFENVKENISITEME